MTPRQQPTDHCNTRACWQSRENSSPHDGRGDQPHGVVMGGALLVACGPAAAGLAAIDQALTPVAETGERSIAGARAPCVPLARAGAPEALLAGLPPKPPAAVAWVLHHAVRAALGAAWPPPLDGPRLQERRKDRRLVAWPRGAEDAHPLATPFGAPVDCGTEPAPAPAEGCGLWGPCLAPVACCGARILVPSRSWTSQCRWPAASACACTAAKRWLPMPARGPRETRRATVRPGPSRSGRSRQGAPVRRSHQMPFRRRRCSTDGRPVLGVWGGSRGWNRSHRVLVKAPRFMPTRIMR